MNILFAASEVAPFIKTGGLADVAGSLPQALAGQGHDVRVILPLYEGVDAKWREQMEPLGSFTVKLSWRNLYCGLYQLDRDGVRYYFVDNEYYYKRSGLYGHFDDAERFAFFCKAVIYACPWLDWHPDIIHANDWQCALIPIYLLEVRHEIPQLIGTKSVFTIHNIEYQGRYSKHIMEDVFGLSWDYFNKRMLEYHDDINLMKGAIYASDFITTVSPTYAEQLRYSFFAHGLEGVIADCCHKIRGILNGLDTALYDPAADPGLARNFTPSDLSGKAECKAALQKAVGLEENPDVPVIACVSRLVSHKGFDLVAAVIDDIMAMDVQMVVLGTGDWKFEELFRETAARYPGRFSAQLMYSAGLSTAIYGGADLFLMPSVSEPCGLSQIIAMRYGTLPVVRETGGLKDTVLPHLHPNGRGFTFADINAHDMANILREAVEMYRENKNEWKSLQYNAMTTDFSWNGPAGQYLDVYRYLLSR